MREHLAAVLERTGWNISPGAEELGLSRNTVRARIERFGLRPSAEPRARRCRPRRRPPSPLRPPRPAGSASRAWRRRPRPRPRRHLVPLPGGTMRWERRRLTFLRATLLRASEVGTLTTTIPGARDHDGQDPDLRRARRRAGLDLGRRHLRARSSRGCPASRRPCRDGHRQGGAARAARRGRSARHASSASTPRRCWWARRVRDPRWRRTPSGRRGARSSGCWRARRRGRSWYAPEAAPLLERRFELTRRGRGARSPRVRA